MSIEAKRPPQGANASKKLFDSTLGDRSSRFQWFFGHRRQILRKASRFNSVVFSLLICVQGCATSSGDFARSGGDFARAKDRVAELLSRAIQFKSVNPPGDEKPLAGFFSETLSKAGIENRVVDTPSGDSKVGRAAAWGVVRGSGERRPLVLLSHLDVVPAEADAWKTDQLSTC